MSLMRMLDTLQTAAAAAEVSIPSVLDATALDAARYSGDARTELKKRFQEPYADWDSERLRVLRDALGLETFFLVLDEVFQAEEDIAYFALCRYVLPEASLIFQHTKRCSKELRASLAKQILRPHYGLKQTASAAGLVGFHLGSGLPVTDLFEAVGERGLKGALDGAPLEQFVDAVSNDLEVVKRLLRGQGTTRLSDDDTRRLLCDPRPGALLVAFWLGLTHIAREESLKLSLLHPELLSVSLHREWFPPVRELSDEERSQSAAKHEALKDLVSAAHKDPDDDCLQVRWRELQEELSSLTEAQKVPFDATFKDALLNLLRQRATLEDSGITALTSTDAKWLLENVPVKDPDLLAVALRAYERETTWLRGSFEENLPTPELVREMTLRGVVDLGKVKLLLRTGLPEAVAATLVCDVPGVAGLLRELLAEGDDERATHLVPHVKDLLGNDDRLWSRLLTASGKAPYATPGLTLREATTLHRSRWDEAARRAAKR